MLFIYSVDEAMFLALHLLMINRSSANIIEVLAIPFACPRSNHESSAILQTMRPRPMLALPLLMKM
jgi:ABC-type nitrate/sulfonate/bicarbonate transport system ATPase subunit